MQTRAEAIKEVTDYITRYVRDGVNVDMLATEIVDADDGQDGHGEVSGYYTKTGRPLVVSFEPSELDA